MHAELPGILAQLIRLSPSVIKGALLRPSSVKVATDELFAELDIATRFITECLLEACGTLAELSDVRTVASHWLQREGLDTNTRAFMGDVEKKFGKRYAFRKIGARNVRVFTDVRLVDCDPQAIIPTKSAG
jgi:phage/plasmid-associated DNA primase